jgi:O-antigen ligase
MTADSRAPEALQPSADERAEAAGARRRLLAVGRWSVLVALFALPFYGYNKPVINVALALALLCSLLAPRLRARWDGAWRQPVALGAAAVFALFALGALHAPSGSGSWAALRPYFALLYPLLVATLLDDDRWRLRGLLAFGVATAIFLLLSWLQFFGLVPLAQFALDNESLRYTVTGDYTQRGVGFIVLAALAAAFAQSAPTPAWRRALWALAALALVNVAIVLQSRTTYLIVAPLLLYGGWRLIRTHYRGWRGVALALLALALIGAALGFSPRMQQRLLASKSEIARYTGQGEPTSMGVRLELWKRSVPIIEAAPWFGHGLGQWRLAYQRQASQAGLAPGFLMGHPHQEALLILSEEGIVGFAVFVALLIGLARHVRSLARPPRDFYNCLLIIYVTAGLANCLLAVFSHRHLFLMLLACLPLAAKPGAANAKASAA